VGHGRGADLVFLDPLLEIIEADVDPDIAVEIDEDGPRVSATRPLANPTQSTRG
jgi:hypothetical protein